MICKEINDLFSRKNHDYGDSFHTSFIEEGMAMPRIRLGDKYSRFKTLTQKGVEQKVDDESIRDTLIDLANYAIMTILEIDQQTLSSAGGSGGYGGAIPNNRTIVVSGSVSPQDASEGLDGDGCDGTQPHLRIKSRWA